MTTSEEKIKQFLSKYKHSDGTKKDILKTCRAFDGLVCKQEPYVFSNGMKKDLVNLSGTIPVPFKGKKYNIPICIWLMDTHPYNAPVCFVCPTSEMSLKISLHLDYNGKVYLPYLHNWTADSSNLIDLIHAMIGVFSITPPVVATKSQTPYPTQPYVLNHGPPQMYPMAQPTASVSQYPPYPVNPGSAGSSPYPTQTPMYHPSGISLSSQPNFYPLSHPQPPPVYQPYPPTTAPVPGPNTTQNNTTVNNTGTITDEHIRASLMSAIEDKMRRKINEQASMYHDEIQILQQSQKEIQDTKSKLEVLYSSLKNEKSDIEKNIQDLKQQEAELEKQRKNFTNEDPVEIDDTVLTTAPLYKQLLNAHCEDLATEDTIYYVGEGLRKGVLDLDVFIKQIRSLSRKQFMLRSLVDKCRVKAGLLA